MKITCTIELEIENSIFDKQRLIYDLDNTLAEFIIENEQTHYAKCNDISIRSE